MDRTVLIWFLVLVAKSMGMHRDFYFHDYQMAPIEKYVVNATMNSSCDTNTPQNPCLISPELKFETLVDLNRPYLHIQGRDMVKNKIVADQVINICAFRASFDMFLKIGYEMIKKNTNFEVKCPLKKGLYVFYEFRNNYGFLLNFYQSNQTQRYTFTLKNRFGKKIENVFVYRVEFEVVDVDD